jgi:hypothetical protein
MSEHANRRIQPLGLAVIGVLGLGTMATTGTDSESLSLRSAVPGDTTVSIDLAFITHLDADLPEQDVYIERVPGSGEIWRVTKGDNDMNAPLYKAAEETPHDPFNADAIGPHTKGEPLGMTSASGSSIRGRAPTRASTARAV